MKPAGLSLGERGLLREAVEVLPGRLYYRKAVFPPHDTPAIHFFSVDKLFVYEPFFLDFGPLNLSCIFKYCKMIKAMLVNSTLRRKLLVHYSAFSQDKVANAVLLLGSFLLIEMKKTPEEAMKPFSELSGSLKPFRDATYSGCDFELSVLDCLRGLSYAMQLNWFSLSTFNQEEYDHYERLENGDMNWIIPGKFLAFSCPSIGGAAMSARRSGDGEGSGCCMPSHHVSVFKKLNIKLVIRLNKKMYDAQVFKDAGIAHYDLFFVDGTCPPRGSCWSWSVEEDEVVLPLQRGPKGTSSSLKGLLLTGSLCLFLFHRGVDVHACWCMFTLRDIMDKFLELCESCDGAVAVHCKAGLGRTGSLIGCYAMKNYKFPALPWIGWNRICRPGSVLGPQQYFLCAIQDELMQMDAIESCRPLLQKRPSRKQTSVDGVDALAVSLQDMRLEDRRVAELGDEGQGDRLMEAKRRSKPAPQVQSSGPRQLQTSISLRERTTPGNKGPMIALSRDRSSSSSSHVDLLLHNKFVGHLLTPIAASAVAARRPPSKPCHIPAAGGPSGMCVASGSRPASSRSRNDV
ncbi:serine threonine specific protein phosphatase [Cyclospora cayetanensis]|uniref:protein-tyrosine-phosphatase n=1 Tax=Cyclospora cayetanensis TaxID=88456 RepID=A0A1D3CR29_9EIME|nr:serine threonine specific protein phosphatase [Cyclospora cayetanensis]